MKDVDLFSGTETSLREIELAFCWSRMGIVNEIRDNISWRCITVTDFLEALCRLAELLVVRIV